MWSSGLILEMEAVDEVLVCCFCLLRRHPLCNKPSIFVDTDDRVFARHLPVELVVVDLEYPDLACLALFWELCLLDQSVDNILDHTILGHQDVVVVLYIAISMYFDVL